jgi:hypothetical protein
MEKANHDRTVTFALGIIVAVSGLVAMMNSLATAPIFLPSVHSLTEQVQR